MKSETFNWLTFLLPASYWVGIPALFWTLDKIDAKGQPLRGLSQGMLYAGATLLILLIPALHNQVHPLRVKFFIDIPMILGLVVLSFRKHRRRIR